MFTLDQLRGFVAVAEELHFGRAAERLRLTQPPLSRQIQKLERSVGVQLLRRDSRRVELTAAGETFLLESRRLLALANGALDEARRIQAGSSGTVRIGFTAASAFGILTELLDQIEAGYPDIHVDLVEAVTREQTARLLDGGLDVGLARPPFDRTAFSSRLLHREELLLAVPLGHRLSGRESVSVDELTNEKLIMYAPAEARYFHDLVVRLLPVRAENVAHTVSQILTMLMLVAGGRGVALVPASATRLAIAGVAWIPLVGLPPEPVELHLLWNRDSHNPALHSVLDLLTRPTSRPE